MTTTVKGAAGYVEPTNRKDRAVFAAMTPEQQDDVRATSALLYDGTRTVAACWHAALLQVRYGR